MALPKEYKEMIPFYTRRFEGDDDDQIYIVQIEELPGCMTHGETMEDAVSMSNEAVEVYLESLYKHKEEIPVPISKQKYKGEFLVRATPELHRKLAMKQKAEGFKTFNKFVVHSLENIGAKPTRTKKTK